MSKKKKPFQKDPEWARAKKLCRLNQDDIRMAKELGFKPKRLIKNIPNKTEQWKAPVKVWIRDLYRKRFGKVLRTNSSPSKKQRENPDYEDGLYPQSTDDSFMYINSTRNDSELQNKLTYEVNWDDDDDLPF